MAETRTYDDIVSDYRLRTAAAERRAKTRVVCTTLLALAAAVYMTWLHATFSKLDAQAVTEIARAEVQSRLPELGDRVTQMALDAAPGLMDRGEQALLAAPAQLADSLEERLATGTDRILDEVTTRLDTQMEAFVTPRLEQLEETAQVGDPPSVDELMQELRNQYRVKATALMDELYVAYAREIGGVNDYLVHLRDGEHLTAREAIEKEIIEASVALRRHYVTPVEPVGTVEDETAVR